MACWRKLPPVFGRTVLSFLADLRSLGFGSINLGLELPEIIPASCHFSIVIHLVGQVFSVGKLGP
jgi:hypothetical protein